MVFSSLIFLYAFFPACMLAYACCKTQDQQNRVLLVFSLIFYSWGGPMYLLLLMFMALVSWYCALQIQRWPNKMLWMTAATVIDIALIVYFKYAGFLCSMFGNVPVFVQNIVLPIGISFYTFQLLTYVVDVYRGEAPAQHSYWNVLLYAALFHQCIAGPIVRYKSIDWELFSPYPRVCDWKNGVSRFSIGLAKKVLLANPCGQIADTLILSTDAIANAAECASNLQFLKDQSVLGCWVGVIAYAMHIYLDFSAYSDMAIGMGQMIGLHYLENFNYPYISSSVTEFWRRWHISLSTFFRDYVYIPLGGSRVNILRSIFNTLVVWLLTGLWHGASWNYVLWGLWFFLLLMIERAGLKKLLPKLSVLSNLYLLIAVSIGWVIFRFTDLKLAASLLFSMFGLSHNPLTDFFSTVYLQNHFILLGCAVIACTPLWNMAVKAIEKCPALQKVWNIIYYALFPAVLLLLSTACLVGDSYNPFLYFQF